MITDWIVLVMGLVVLLLIFTAIILFYTLPQDRIWALWVLVLISVLQVILIGAALMTAIDRPQFCKFESTSRVGMYIPDQE